MNGAKPLNDKPQLLTEPVSSPQRLDETYHILPLDEEFPKPLTFQITLLRTWRGQIVDENGPSPTKPMTTLFRAFDPDGTGEVLVHAALLPREVHGADWLRVHIREAGYQVLDWRELPSRKGRMGDALVAGNEETAGMGHRLTTIKDGRHLFLIDSRLTSPDPVAQEPSLIAVINFNLLAPTGQDYAEPFRETDLAAAQPVRFLVSAMWHEPEAGTSPPENGAIRKFLHRSDDTTLATMIAVAGVHETHSTQQLEDTTISQLEANGMARVSEPDILSNYTQPDGDLRILARVWAASRGGVGMSLFSAQIMLKGVPVVICMVTPSPETHLELWAIHRRAFDIAVNSLHPGW